VKTLWRAEKGMFVGGYRADRHPCAQSFVSSKQPQTTLNTAIALERSKPGP
jgi:hypothetical protein